MNESEKIGRLILLKLCILFVGLALLIPVIFDTIDTGRLNAIIAISEFYKINSMDESDVIFLLIQFLLLSMGIWFFGGKAGRLIISQEKPKTKIGFMAVFKLWILFTLTSFIYEGTNKLGWAVSGTLLALLLGALLSLIAGYFMTKMIQNKGRQIS